MIINLSSVESIDITLLEYDSKRWFVGNNKYIKKDIAGEFKTLCSSVNKDISLVDQENFREFLRSVTITFTQNVYRIKDRAYNLLKLLQTNKDIVQLSGDEDASLVLDISFYKEKINRLIYDGISKGVYAIEENGNKLTD